MLIPPSLGILFRFHSRQCRDATHDILERLLVLLGWICRSLPFNILPIVPLNLKSGQNDTRVEAVDILVGIGRQAFQGANDIEKLVDILTG